MKQLIAIVITLILVIAIWLTGYFLYHRKVNFAALQSKLLTNRIHLADRDLEEELTFFLARQMGIYEGNFEIIDVVSLEARETAGADYLLVTLRTPDGQLCQVIISRSPLPWAKWEIQPKTFNLLQSPGALAASSDNNKAWMKELGITPQEVQQYFNAHPQAILKGEGIFLNQETGIHRLPEDWFETIKPGPQNGKLPINKNEPTHFVPGMKAESADALWQPDYPSGYLGSGYRSYLYKKVKEEK